ncbi:MAG TPA: ABC transporter permease subunit [Nitrospirae bacterium]|nr:putative aliphatic sulfonates transport permease protein SsuC [bacterium BMS3Abin06]HDH12721.1 ABC transporter permease subunit [Nitrospirota bacterium]HDZ00030.1 ABC transporter permease subunit [Nitrospirota bacterium]
MKYKTSLIGIFSAVTIWQIIAWLKIFNPIYFASPYEVIAESIKMIQGGAVFIDLTLTIYRIAVSVIISSLIGIPLGIAFGYFARIYKYVGEIVDFLRSIPPIVIYPLLLIVLGPGDSSRIGVALFGSIVVLVLIISNGLFQQAPLRRQYFASLGANKVQLVNHIVWYEALPHVMVALRTAVSLSIIIIVVTEMLVGAQYGLGTRVQNVQITSNIPDLFVTIIIIGLIGVLFNKTLICLDKKLVFWKSN